MQAFGYLYDFSNLVRHFREILCEGQIAAFKIKQATYEGEHLKTLFDSADM